MKPDSLSRRVLAGLFDVGPQHVLDTRPPAITGYSVARRTLAGLLGVTLPDRTIVPTPTVPGADPTSASPSLPGDQPARSTTNRRSYRQRSTAAVGVRIENGILWINSEACPLRNISRVGSRWVDPGPIKARAVKNFIVRTLLCLVVAGIVSSASTASGVLVFIVGMALVIWRLAAALQLRPIYGLVLNAAGVQQEVIWSFEEREIRKLVVAITDAMGHLDTATKIINVNHVVSGDIIQLYGVESVGKQAGAGVGR